MSRVPLRNRCAVLERSQGTCERCSCSLTNTPADIHHRRPRGMGGTSDPEIHDPANLLALCRTCHRWVEEHRAQAREQGWLISLHDPRQPCEVPIYTGGLWYLIGEQWEIFNMEPPF